MAGGNKDICSIKGRVASEALPDAHILCFKNTYTPPFHVHGPQLSVLSWLHGTYEGFRSLQEPSNLNFNITSDEGMQCSNRMEQEGEKVLTWLKPLSQPGCQDPSITIISAGIHLIITTREAQLCLTLLRCKLKALIYSM